MDTGGLFTGSQMLQMAVQMEQDGRAFYLAAAETAPAGEAADVFRVLADEETKHEQTFRDMLNETQGSDEWAESYEGEHTGYVEALLHSRALPSAEQGERLAAQSADARYALEFALQFEKDSVLFYDAMMQFAKGAHTDTVADIIAEEKSHVARILKLMRQLS